MISAQGELQASETLAEAARVMSTQPASLQLRYLQTVTEIATENNSTTIFPMPIDMLSAFFRRGSEAATGSAAAPSPAQATVSPPATLQSGDITQALPQIRVDAAPLPANESAAKPTGS